MHARDDDLVKYMSSLLKAGASMLSEVCPRCGVPLFKLKSGEVICPQCRQRVYIVKDEREEASVRRGIILEYLQEVICDKIDELSAKIMSAKTIDELNEYLKTLNLLLLVLEKAKKLSEY